MDEKDRPAGIPPLCNLPEVPEREFPPEVAGDRLRLIRVLDKKWVNGTTLRYHFLNGGPADDREVVRRGFAAWAEVGIGLRFEEVDRPDDAEIRIGFLHGGGSWSYVGRDCLNISPREPTMNFGWHLARGGGGRDDLDTAIHEIGHALGFPHEHQNPNAGIVWDEAAVYRSLAAPPNRWPRATTYHNILRKLPASSVDGSPWDPDSVMHYPFGPGLIVRPERFRRGLTPEPGLSEADRREVRKFYPPAGGLDEPRPLRLYEPVRLSLGPGEQADFLIELQHLHKRRSRRVTVWSTPLP